MNNASKADLNFRIVTVLLSGAGRKTTLASHEVARIFLKGWVGGKVHTVSQQGLPDCFASIQAVGVSDEQ